MTGERNQEKQKVKLHRINKIFMNNQVHVFLICTDSFSKKLIKV